GVDRTQLREDYEAALKALAEQRFEEAASQLTLLLASLPATTRPRPALTGERNPSQSTAGEDRDETWLRRFSGLCLRNLSDAQRSLGLPVAALKSLKRALSANGGDSDSDKDGALWRAAAECALESADWLMARVSFEQCLLLWPEDPLLLRGLAKALLQLGDLPACQRVLEVLRAARPESFGPGGKEAWLLRRLETRFEAPSQGQKRGPPSELDGWEGEEKMGKDYEALCLSRRKRLRLSAQPPEEEAVELGLTGFSVIELLQVAKAAAARALAPSQVVVVVPCPQHQQVSNQEPADNRQGSDADPKASLQGGALPHAEATPSETACLLSDAFLQALKPFLVDPWPTGESPVRWLLKSLPIDRATSAKAGPCPQASAREAEAVKSFLGIDESGKSVGSQGLQFREWLLRVVSFSAEQWPELMKGSANMVQVTQLQVELLCTVAHYVRPGQNAEAMASASSSSWASTQFLTWASRPRQESELRVESPRLAMRNIICAHGLHLAEACTDPKAHSRSLDQHGRDLLKAWLLWHPFLGLEGTGDGNFDVAAVRQWLLAAVRPEEWWKESAVNENALIGAFAASDPKTLVEAIRFLWAAAALTGPLAGASRTSLEQHELALRRCRALAVAQRASPGTQIETSWGEKVTPSVIDERLKTVQKERAAPLECNPATAEDGSEATAAEAKDGQDIEELAGQVIAGKLRLPRSLSVGMTTELVEKFYSLARQAEHDSFRLAEDNRQDLAQEAKVNLVFEAVSKLLCQMAWGFAEQDSKVLTDEDTSAVMSKYINPIFLILSAATKLLDLLEAPSRLRGESADRALGGKTNPVFLGIQASGCQGVGLFLTSACEHVALSCLLLGTELGKAACGGGPSCEWMPIAHAALSLGTKALGTVLWGSAGSGVVTRGSLLLMPRDVGGLGSALSARELWSKFPRFLTAGHECTMFMTEYMKMILTTPTWDPKNLYSASSHLFGKNHVKDFALRLNCWEETKLSYPHILLGLALRADCGVLARWRAACASWLYHSTSIQNRGATTCRRALDGRDGEAPPKGLLLEVGEELLQEEEITHCQLLARGLTCIWPRAWIDLRPPARMARIGLCLGRMLSEPSVYHWSCGAGLELEAQRLFQVERISDIKAKSPHVLALALAVHQCLARVVPDSQDAILQSLLPYLEVQNFRGPEVEPEQTVELVDLDDSRASKVSVVLDVSEQKHMEALFHPALIGIDFLAVIEGTAAAATTAAAGQEDVAAGASEANDSEAARQSSSTSPKSVQRHMDLTPYTDILRRLREISAGSLAQMSGRIPAELLASCTDRDGEARRSALGLVAKRVEQALQRQDWPAGLQVRLRGKTPDFAEEVPLVDCKDLERLDMKTGLDLWNHIAAVPAIPEPLRPLDGVFAELARSRITGLDPLEANLIEIILFAVKDVAICPSREESWTCAAVAFKHLYFVTDDANCREGNLRNKLQDQHLWAWTKLPCTSTPTAALRWMYGQARMLNSMLRSKHEHDLMTELATLANSICGSEQIDGSVHLSSQKQAGFERCRQLAKQWFERQLDRISLFRCLRRSLQDSDASSKAQLLTQRILFIARQLLWFMVHCSDLGSHGVFQTSQDVIARFGEAWPRPSFWSAWRYFEARHKLHLFELMPKGVAPPWYVWQAPYQVARAQWQLLSASPTQGSSITDKNDAEDILGLLTNASILESWAQKKLDEMGKLNRPPLIECSWKLHSVRLKLIHRLPADGWKIAATLRGDGGDEPLSTREAVCKDCVDTLAKLSFSAERRYKGKTALALACFYEAEGDNPHAVHQVSRIFSWPMNGASSIKLGGPARIPCTAVGNGLDPLMDQERRLRKIDSLRARGLLLSLRVFRRAVQQMLPDPAAAASSSSSRPPLLNVRVKTEPGVDARLEVGHESRIAAMTADDADEVAQVLQSLDSELSQTFQVLEMSSEILVGFARFREPSPGDEAWYGAFDAAIIRNVRMGFDALLQAGKGFEEPYWSWKLLCTFRSCCIGLQLGRPAVAPEDQQHLLQCYATAALQLQSYARRKAACFRGEAVSPASSVPGLVGKPWDAGEVFFIAVTRMMPYSQGLWGNSTEHTADGSLKRQILIANAQRSDVDKPGAAMEVDAATISLDESDDEPLLRLA
ncbi:unnamed protein product, partial [Polarella glacialis]